MSAPNIDDAVLGVTIRVLATDPMVDVHRPHVVAQGAKDVPEARRVRPARDEAGDASPLRDEGMLRNLRGRELDDVA